MQNGMAPRARATRTGSGRPILIMLVLILIIVLIGMRPRAIDRFEDAKKNKGDPSPPTVLAVPSVGKTPTHA